MQALELDTERKHRTLPFEIILTDKNIEQSDNLFATKASSINQKSIEIPLQYFKNWYKMDINNELLKETEWLDPNISNLSDD